ncbi:MAG: OmpA family protein, partial [Gemmatimonadetes bacterium]|nr:OmpA family protein [Gemmatimonadota bacterium]
MRTSWLERGQALAGRYLSDGQEENSPGSVLARSLHLILDTIAGDRSRGATGPAVPPERVRGSPPGREDEVMRWKRSVVGAAAIAVAAVGGSSCAHVSQKDLDVQLGTLRGDLVDRMDRGDAALSARVDGLAGDVGALRAELDAMRRDFGVKVEELEQSLRVYVPVHFGFDRSEVEPEAREILDRFAGVANRYYPGAHLTGEGCTDPAGSAAYNLRLGQRRADAVKEYLVTQGMPSERVRAVSYGENTDRLVAPDAQGALGVEEAHGQVVETELPLYQPKDLAQQRVDVEALGEGAARLVENRQLPKPALQSFP